MSGQLFTQYYLTEGIKPTIRSEVFRRQRMQAFRDRIRVCHFDALEDHQQPQRDCHRARTDPSRAGIARDGPTTCRSRAWPATRTYPTTCSSPSADAKARAAASRRPGSSATAEALVVEESKRFGLRLDARDEHDTVRARTPHGQILRYLSYGGIRLPMAAPRWGILTNGGVWRLYDRRARPRATGYFEVDLADSF